MSRWFKGSRKGGETLSDMDELTEGSWHLPSLAEYVDPEFGPRREVRLESFLARDGIRKILERARAQLEDVGTMTYDDGSDFGSSLDYVPVQEHELEDVADMAAKALARSHELFQE